jgi:hypothetical protein
VPNAQTYHGVQEVSEDELEAALAEQQPLPPHQRPRSGHHAQHAHSPGAPGGSVATSGTAAAAAVERLYEFKLDHLLKVAKATLFKCARCGELFSSAAAASLPCGAALPGCALRMGSAPASALCMTRTCHSLNVAAALPLQVCLPLPSEGTRHSRIAACSAPALCHEIDRAWSLRRHVARLCSRRAPATWRAVYWHVYGVLTVHTCTVCGARFAAADAAGCADEAGAQCAHSPALRADSPDAAAPLHKLAMFGHLMQRDLTSCVARGPSARGSRPGSAARPRSAQAPAAAPHRRGARQSTEGSDESDGTSEADSASSGSAARSRAQLPCQADGAASKRAEAAQSAAVAANGAAGDAAAAGALVDTGEESDDSGVDAAVAAHARRVAASGPRARDPGDWAQAREAGKGMLRARDS